PLNKVAYNDPVSNAIRDRPNTFGQEHLWAINQLGIQTGPWEYWDSTFWKQVPHPFGGSIHSNAISTNPDMSIEKANRYIDTALVFFSPRAFTALKLNEAVCSCDEVVPDPDIFLFNDFECQRNHEFGAGNDRLMIMDNPDGDDGNRSEKVGAYFEGANDPWAALCINSGDSIDLSTFNVFKVDVNSPFADIQFLLKLEGGTSPAYEVWVNSDTMCTWETLEADFSSQRCANHTRICIFTNAGVESPNEVSYFFDNLRLEKSGLQCLVGTENPVIETLNISPNPTNDVVYIRHFSSAVHFRVMNSLGQQVAEVKADGREVVSIDMQSFYPGIYMVGAYNGDGKLIGNARIMKN
ncbi:MAG: T9SS type A sorting domain-containing protein, partial [Saprospiraceae bacterium]